MAQPLPCSVPPSSHPYGIKAFHRTFHLPVATITLAPDCPFSLTRDKDGFHIPYHEYRGNGPPNELTSFGTPGDIYIDISEESCNLYARIEQPADQVTSWKLWCGPAPTVIANEPILSTTVGSNLHRSLIRYPYMKHNRYLWCDGKTIMWRSLKFLKTSRSQIFSGEVLPPTRVGTGAWLVRGFLDQEGKCSQNSKRTISETNEPDEAECESSVRKKTKLSDQSQWKPEELESVSSATEISSAHRNTALVGRADGPVDQKDKANHDNEGPMLRARILSLMSALTEGVQTADLQCSTLVPAEDRDGIVPSPDVLSRQSKDVTDLPNQSVQGRSIHGEGTALNDISRILLLSSLREPHIQNMTQILKQVMEDARGEVKQMQDQMEREKTSSQKQIKELESRLINVKTSHASEMKRLEVELYEKKIRDLSNTARSTVNDTQQQVQELTQSMTLLKQQNAYLSEKLARTETLHATKVEALNKELETESSLRKMAEEHMQTILSAHAVRKPIQ